MQECMYNSIQYLIVLLNTFSTLYNQPVFHKNRQFPFMKYEIKVINF